jgi:hypothetical protein
MRVQRRTNLIFGAVLFASVLLTVANTLNLLPPGVFELALRAAPALLILAGVYFILRDRVPLSALIALIIAAAAAGVIGVTAYNDRAGRLSNITQQTIDETVSADITLLRIDVAALATEIELNTRVVPGRALSGTFAGAAANRIDVQYAENTDNTGNLTVRETQREGFPDLLDVGRGTLRVELPPDIPLDVQIVGENGAVTLNMSGLALERLNVQAGSGGVVITLPDYDPLFSQPSDTLGEITVANGDLTIFIPRAVSGQFDLAIAGEPEYDPAIYNLLANGVLEARDLVIADQVVRYTLIVPRGRTRIEAPS